MIMQYVSGIYEILFCIASILAIFGVPLTAAVCFIVFLVKYIKCGADRLDRKKLLKTNTVIFGAMTGSFIVLGIVLIWLSSKTIVYITP